MTKGPPASDGPFVIGHLDFVIPSSFVIPSFVIPTPAHFYTYRIHSMYFAPSAAPPSVGSAGNLQTSLPSRITATSCE